KKTAKTTVVKRQRAGRMSPEARRVQLISCAIEAFAQRGILNTTHGDISKLAGVANPTVFHYFPTIDILQQEVIKEVRRYLLEGFVLSRAHIDRSASERIEDMLSSFRKSVDSDQDFIVIWLEWSGMTRGPLWELYLEFYRDTVAAIRSLILEGRKDNSINQDIEASDGARIILSTAHAIAHGRLSGSSSKTIQKTVHSLVSLYIAPKN
ncbi:MAG: TetR/AcrR family transcriptional regulator, partial [Spongiibacteraceae bacterium]